MPEEEPKKEQEDFVKEATKPIDENAKPVEPEIQFEGTPKEETLPDTSATDELAKLQEENARLTQENAVFKATPPPVETQAQPKESFDLTFDGLDPLEEGYQKKLEKVVEAKVRKEYGGRMDLMETILLNQAHETGVAQSKSAFGERFDFDKNGNKLMEIQKKVPGLGVGDAHRISDYDKVLNELNELKQVKAGASQTMPAGGATRQQTDVEAIVVQPLNDTEKDVASAFGQTHEEFAKRKYDFEQKQKQGV